MPVGGQNGIDLGGCRTCVHLRRGERCSLEANEGEGGSEGAHDAREYDREERVYHNFCGIDEMRALSEPPSAGLGR